jgi:hypothetical protein
VTARLHEGDEEMEKEKRKNESPEFSKTPLGSSCFFILKMIVLTAVIIPTIFVVRTVSTIFWINWEANRFIEDNTPLVQEAVRNQCSMSDYIAEGSFNTSSDLPLPYHDFDEGEELRIDCNLIDEAWQCTCPND